MKPFVVRIPAPGPHWWSWLLSHVCFVFGVSALAGAFIIRKTDPALFLACIYTAMLANFLALAFRAVSKLERERDAERTELTKRLAEQDERIRKLEEQLAALTEPTPTY